MANAEVRGIACACGRVAETRDMGDWITTLVGIWSPPGHNHDDNCIRGYLRCPCGLGTFVVPQRACGVEGCDWLGKADCFCTGPKSGLYVNAAPRSGGEWVYTGQVGPGGGDGSEEAR